MATYITLMKFTDQGIRTVKDTVKRAKAAEEAGSKLGVTLKNIYWTEGQYDIMAVWEAADEASLLAFGLSVGMAGNVRTETLHAFSRDEMTSILSKLP